MASVVEVVEAGVALMADMVVMATALAPHHPTQTCLARNPRVKHRAQKLLSTDPNAIPEVLLTMGPIAEAAPISVDAVMEVAASAAPQSRQGQELPAALLSISLA